MPFENGLSSPRVSVIIPALNEEKRIVSVVTFALAEVGVAEVIVVDDSSIDMTVALAKQAGARVITSTMLGKGASMYDGLVVARCDIVVYLDGDLAGLRKGTISELCAPLLAEKADFVKARFARSGGRVTELTAKPFLKIFFPELSHFAQPLGGVIAARKSLLNTLVFEDGYGVDIGILLDAYRAGARFSEVDIGLLENDSQPLVDLTVMANDVTRVILNRARAAGRLNIEQVLAMYESQRQAAAGIEYVLSRRKGRQRLVLLDMDGTITPGRFVVELASVTGREHALSQLLDNQENDAITRSEAIARLFQYVHKQTFENVARSLAIRPGVVELVNKLRRHGFMVGLVSDSYFVAADIVRRRIFADFAMAHTMHFENEVCSGLLRINPAFLSDPEGRDLGICKSNVLRRFMADQASSPITETWVVGDNLNDLALMLIADRAFAIEPKSPLLQNDPRIEVIATFEDLMDQVQ